MKLVINYMHYIYYCVGGNCVSSICCLCPKTSTRMLGICQSQLHGSLSWTSHLYPISQVEGNHLRQRMVYTYIYTYIHSYCVCCFHKIILIIIIKCVVLDSKSWSYRRANDENALEVDFGAIEFTTPHLTIPSSIGEGLSYTTKFLTSKLSGKLENSQPLVDYLLSLDYQGEVCTKKENKS